MIVANTYSISEQIKNVYYLLMTKITMRRARFVRRPIFIRGRKSLEGGKNLTTGRFCRFDLDGKKKTLFIGDNCEFGDMTHIVAHERVEFGNHVLVASKCFISDTNHGDYRGEKQDSPYTAPNARPLITSSVCIGNNVWIGENVIVLPGVSIGDGSIIGANSVVNKNIPEGVIAVGSPAIVVKIWNEEARKWEVVK